MLTRPKNKIVDAFLLGAADDEIRYNTCALETLSPSVRFLFTRAASCKKRQRGGILSYILMR